MPGPTVNVTAGSLTSAISTGPTVQDAEPVAEAEA